MSDDRHDAVSRRAYELWEQEGGEHGRHEDHWHRAVSELDANGASGGAAAPDGTTLPDAGPDAGADAELNTGPEAGPDTQPDAAGAEEAAPAAAAPRAARAPAAKPRKPKPTAK